MYMYIFSGWKIISRLRPDMHYILNENVLKDVHCFFGFIIKGKVLIKFGCFLLESC